MSSDSSLKHNEGKNMESGFLDEKSSMPSLSSRLACFSPAGFVDYNIQCSGIYDPKSKKSHNDSNVAPCGQTGFWQHYMTNLIWFFFCVNNQRLMSLIKTDFRIEIRIKYFDGPNANKCIFYDFFNKDIL